MNGQQLSSLLRRTMPVLEEARDELRDLDAAIGDGDLGITVASSAQAVTVALSEGTWSTPTEVLRAAAKCFASANPSTFSALVAAALLAAARTTEGADQLDRPAAIRLARAAAEMIANRGGAELGDKTVLDALVPSIDALQDADDDDAGALAHMIVAAEQGVARTQSSAGRRGRSAWVGERGAGHADGGATAYLRFLEALLQTWVPAMSPEHPHNRQRKAAVESVLIVGGGIGGLSASIALGQQGISSTVLERDGGAAGASIGFTAQAIHALQELEVLDEILARGHHYKIGERTWWGRVYNADGELMPVTEPDLQGWTLPTSLSIQRRILHEIMRERARSHGAEILIPHTYSSLEQDDQGVEVELSTGERRRFELVVSAEGVHSTLRDRFFPEVGPPHYTGSMSFRVQFDHAPAAWLSGLHFTEGTTIATNETPGEGGRGTIFYLGIPNHMERRRIEQDEAREIVRRALGRFRSQTFTEVLERFDDETPVLVAPYEWVFVPAPLHRGRIVVLGDTAHATAPTLGSAGGMAIEDGVVLAQELGATSNLDRALKAYADRRVPRTQLVVETSVALMRAHQEHRPVQEESGMRVAALQRLIEPY